MEQRSLSRLALQSEYCTHGYINLSRNGRWPLTRIADAGLRRNSRLRHRHRMQNSMPSHADTVRLQLRLLKESQSAGLGRGEFREHRHLSPRRNILSENIGSSKDESCGTPDDYCKATRCQREYQSGWMLTQVGVDLCLPLRGECGGY